MPLHDEHEDLRYMYIHYRKGPKSNHSFFKYSALACDHIALSRAALLLVLFQSYWSMETPSLFYMEYPKVHYHSRNPMGDPEDCPTRRIWHILVAASACLYVFVIQNHFQTTRTSLFYWPFFSPNTIHMLNTEMKQNFLVCTKDAKPEEFVGNFSICQTFL